MSYDNNTVQDFLMTILSMNSSKRQASMKKPGKDYEDHNSGCWRRVRGLYAEKGEAVGHGGGEFNNDNPLKWAEKYPHHPMQFTS